MTKISFTAQVPAPIQEEKSRIIFVQEESTNYINRYQCTSCKKEFIFENKDDNRLIEINYCPMCGKENKGRNNK